MSRKPSFIASRDRGAVDIDLSDVPAGGAVINLDDDDPNNIEIIEIDDTPEKDRGKPTVVLNPADEPTEEELRGYGTRAQERIKRQTFELHTERRGRETSDRERDEAIAVARRFQAENETLKRSAGTTATVLANSMIKERETALATARQKLATAHSEGDSEAIADATGEVSTLSAELAMIKAQAPRQPAAPVVDPNNPNPAPAPKRETPPLEPNVAAWISDNRDWFGRPGHEEKTAVAYAVHDRLVKGGVMPSTDAYTKGLDEGLQKVFKEHKSKAERDTPTREPGRADTVNGGSRQQPTERNPSPRSVTLTASQLKLANNLGVTPQAYAASLVSYQAKQKGSAQ